MTSGYLGYDVVKYKTCSQQQYWDTGIEGIPSTTMWTRRCSERRGFARLAAMSSSETQLQYTAKVPGQFVECRSPGRIAVMTAFVDQRSAVHTQVKIDFVHDLAVAEKHRNSRWRRTGSDG